MLQKTHGNILRFILYYIVFSLLYIEIDKYLKRSISNFSENPILQAAGGPNQPEPRQCRGL